MGQEVLDALVQIRDSRTDSDCPNFPKQTYLWRSSSLNWIILVCGSLFQSILPKESQNLLSLSAEEDRKRRQVFPLDQKLLMLSQGIIQPDTTPFTRHAINLIHSHCSWDRTRLDTAQLTTQRTTPFEPCFRHKLPWCPLITEKFDSSHYTDTDLFRKIEKHGKIKNLYLIFSAFELGFGDAVADLDLAKVDRYYKDNVTSLGKKSFRCWWRM